MLAGCCNLRRWPSAHPAGTGGLWSVSMPEPTAAAEPWIVQVGLVAGSVPASGLADVLAALGELLQTSPHLEFLLRWISALCIAHSTAIGAACRTGPGAQPLQGSHAAVLPPLRALNRAVAKLHEDLGQAAEQNLFSLQYLGAAASIAPRDSEPPLAAVGPPGAAVQAVAQ